MKKGLISKTAYKKISAGHPWLTAKDVLQRTDLPNRPSAVLFGENWWLYSPESFLRMRRLGPSMSGWMHTSQFQSITNADKFQSYFGPWLKSHLLNTLKKKVSALKIDLQKDDLCLRWVFSENDELPGLIVDLFDDHAACQINSAPIETFWFVIRESLRHAYETFLNESGLPAKPLQFVELRNTHVRIKEGLSVIQIENPLPPKTLRWNHLLWQMTPAGTQKTGAYFDQRDNHTETAKLALEKKYQSAWDLCSYQGGFSLHLLKAGLNVTAVDQSQEALQAALANVRLNGFNEKKFTVACADIFDWLTIQTEQNNTADLIVLDPPSFVKNRNDIAAAMRGYIDIHTLAMKCLNPGGALVTSICSHHISAKLFDEIVATAAKKSGRQFQVIKRLGPAADHTPAKGFEEGHYLQTQHLLFASRN